MHRLKNLLSKHKNRRIFFLSTIVAVFFFTGCVGRSADNLFYFTTVNKGITFSVDSGLIQVFFNHEFKENLGEGDTFEIRHVDENTLLTVVDINVESVNTQEIGNYFKKGTERRNEENSLIIVCTPKKILPVGNDERKVTDEDLFSFPVNIVVCKITHFDYEKFFDISATVAEKTAQKKQALDNKKIVFPLTTINFQNSTSLKFNFIEKWRSITSKDWLSFFKKFTSFSYTISVGRK